MAVMRSITNSSLLSRLARPLNLPFPRLLQTLAYEEVRASNDRPHSATAFVLHGLLGSGRNWRSFSRNVASYLSNSDSTYDWRFILVDLRNHGRSAEIESLHPPHDLVNAAKDLANLVESKGWNWPDIIIGHSMGGKVALQFAQSCAHGDYGESASFPRQLWVLDSNPGEVNREKDNGEVVKILKTLQGLPTSVPSRKWVVNHMMGLGFSKPFSEWIGSNLKKTGDVETWAFNLEGALQMFNSYQDKSYWPLLEHPPKGMEIEIVRAENSDRWDPHVVRRLENLPRGDGTLHGKVSVHVLPNSGHWVHVDNTKGLVEIVAPKIASLGG